MRFDYVDINNNIIILKKGNIVPVFQLSRSIQIITMILNRCSYENESKVFGTLEQYLEIKSKGYDIWEVVALRYKNISNIEVLIWEEYGKIISKERLEYEKKRLARKKKIEDCEISKLFEDAVVDSMQSKNTFLKLRYKCCVDELKKSIKELFAKDKNSEEYKNCITTALLLSHLNRNDRIFNSLDSWVGIEVVKRYAYLYTYEEIISSMRKATKGKDKKLANIVGQYLENLYKNNGFENFFDKESNIKAINSLYNKLVEGYGDVINSDVLTFLYIVYGMDWKKIKDGESNIIEMLFPENKSNRVCEIYSAYYGKVQDSKEIRRKIYEKLYDIVKKIIKKKKLSDNMLINEVYICKGFLMEMYIEVVFKIKNDVMLNDVVLAKKRKHIADRAKPLFCQIFYDAKTYEDNRMLSYMLQVTNNELIIDGRKERDDRLDDHDKKVRSGQTKYYNGLRCLLMFDSAKEKNVSIDEMSIQRIRKKCEKRMYKEFRGVPLPLWRSVDNSSKTANRFNCMMLIAGFYMCKWYENPAQLSTLFAWLQEFKTLYKAKEKDVTYGKKDINHIISIWRIKGMIAQDYCLLIAILFADKVLNKEKKNNALQTISNKLWEFQQNELNYEKMKCSIEDYFWKDFNMGWYPFNSD